MKIRSQAKSELCYVADRSAPTLIRLNVSGDINMAIYSEKKYCVYLTTYTGNKLPPFYIGSTSLKRFNSGYRGSVKSKKYKEIFKQEIKENPHLFRTQIISKYYSRKMATFREKRLQISLNVVKSSMYYNESFACVNGMFGRDTSGKNHPLFGIGHSDKARKNISLSHADVTGAKNPRARKVLLISPSGEFIMCHGDLAKKCELWGFSHATIYANITSDRKIIKKRKNKGLQYCYAD